MTKHKEEAFIAFIRVHSRFFAFICVKSFVFDLPLKDKSSHPALFECPPHLFINPLI